MSKLNYQPPKGEDIWDKYFPVRMLYMHSRNPTDMRKFGTRVSGIPGIDRNLDKQEVFTEMNIDRMFEKWRTGVTIHLVRYDDSAQVYRIIHAHLLKWAEYMANSINNGNAPLKDLIELDDFANVVYDKATSVFSPEIKQSALAANFTNVQTINFHNVLKRAIRTDEVSSTPGVEVTRITTDKDKNNGILPRNSLKDLFASEVKVIENWKNR